MLLAQPRNDSKAVTQKLSVLAPNRQTLPGHVINFKRLVGI
jgi:hypothetical protein